ncbi:transposase [Acetobacter aceti NRIC 0242]|nr:transposase [Acetobacter aceti NRIC 0242]
MERIRPYFPLAHDVPRVDDRRVLSGIVYVIRNGLQRKDAPKAYGPHKTLYNRFIRWSRLGVFDRIFVDLTEQTGRSKRLMIDETHLKAHRMASSLLKKGLFPAISDEPKTD